MRWSARLLVWALLVGILGLRAAPAVAVPDDEDASLSYFFDDDDDEGLLWVVSDKTRMLLPEVGTLVIALRQSATVVVLAPCVCSLVVDSSIRLRSPPTA